MDSVWLICFSRIKVVSWLSAQKYVIMWIHFCIMWEAFLHTILWISIVHFLFLWTTESTNQSNTDQYIYLRIFSVWIKQQHSSKNSKTVNNDPVCEINKSCINSKMKQPLREDEDAEDFLQFRPWQDLFLFSILTGLFYAVYTFWEPVASLNLQRVLCKNFTQRSNLCWLFA